MSHAMYDSPCMTVCSILMFQSFGIIKLLFLTKLNILFQSGDSDDPFGGNQFGESGFVSSNQEQTFEQPFDQSGFDQPFDQSDAFPAVAQPGPIATQNSVVSVEIPWGDDPFATNAAPAALPHKQAVTHGQQAIIKQLRLGLNQMQQQPQLVILGLLLAIIKQRIHFKQLLIHLG